MLCAGVVQAIRHAVRSYRQDHGNFDWFQLDIPLTPEKICLVSKSIQMAPVTKRHNPAGKVHTEVQT